MHPLSPPHLSLIPIMLFGLISLAGCGGGNPEGGSPTPPVRKGPATDPDIIEGDLRVEPTSLVVTGVSQCSTPTRRSVTLHNDGETEEIVERVIASCGCARVELPEGTAIAPGGSIEVPILFEALGGSRRKTHEVRFILSDARLGPRLTLDVDVVSPLRTIPSACQEGLHVDGRIRITADAERSFTVLGVSPELPWASEEAMDFEQVVVIDWAALKRWAQTPEAQADPRVIRDEQGNWDRIDLEVRTDDPACPTLHVDLYNDTYTTPVWMR